MSVYMMQHRSPPIDWEWWFDGYLAGVRSKPLLASVVFSRFSLRCWMLDVRWWTVNLKRIWIIVGIYKACMTPFLCLERAINGVIFGNSAVSVVRSNGMLGKLLSSESVSICTTEHCLLVWRNRPYHSGSCRRYKQRPRNINQTRQMKKRSCYTWIEVRENSDPDVKNWWLYDG